MPNHVKDSAARYLACASDKLAGARPEIDRFAFAIYDKVRATVFGIVINATVAQYLMGTFTVFVTLRFSLLFVAAPRFPYITHRYLLLR